MLMNAVEKALIASPARQALQRWYEVPVLLRLAGGPLDPGARALEVGCGTGYGIGLVLDRFGAASVDGMDLDPSLLARARRRWDGDRRVRLAGGSATDLRGALGAEDGSYDAVFDFAILHHIPDWRATVTEVARALRPGGRFVFDEVTAHALAPRSYRVLLDHPSVNRFSAEDFLVTCEATGLEVLAFTTRVQGDYLLGATRRR
jgi:SAM-dependent methyltransferase